MSLLEKAYLTYEYQKDIVGVLEEGKKPLVPVSHMMANAQIEIFLDRNGKFVSANEVQNEGTIIPATPESASRSGTGAKDRPHPLSDQLMFLADGMGGDFQKYLNQLRDWTASDCSHPKLQAILNYIQSGTVLKDLQSCGIIESDGFEKSGKKMVRWIVMNTGTYDEAWRDKELIDAYIRWYDKQLAQKPKGLCSITWEEGPLADSHPKGVLNYANGAKLISSNDNDNFTYRGRFTSPDEAVTVGYYATQKAHNALRYLTSNYGAQIGNRTFLWWKLAKNEPVDPYLNFLVFSGGAKDSQEKVIQFRRELKDTLMGKSDKLNLDGEMVVAALEAATTGRLSVTYYSEMKAWDFANRIHHWYESMTYSEKGYTPSLVQIIKAAFGSERGTLIEVDDRILSENVQHLLHCVVDGAPLPKNIVIALLHKFSRPLAYKDKNNLKYVQNTAFAIIKKYRNERFKEDWTLSVKKECKDRSYLFGRLLAVAEKMEKDTYGEEVRTTNAAKFQSAFTQHPMSTWKVLNEKLNPYKQRLEKTRPASFRFYEKLICEIMETLDPDDPMLNMGLSELYVLGYSHQIGDLYKKHTAETDTQNENK